MKIALILSCFSLLIYSCSSSKTRELASKKEVKKITSMIEIPGIKRKLRSAYFLEQDKLKGCVLYLQGLGDSLNNHDPFFSSLNQAGYRVITFDYLGQGGSEGSMNKTRVSTSLPPDVTGIMMRRYLKKNKYYEIGNQAEHVWGKLSKIKNKYGQSCEESKKLVVGWSTGGLAAYKMAKDKKADAVVLLAPGINIKLLVGEAASSPSRMLFFKEVITERTLTRNKFKGMLNPHKDEVKPKSPAYIPQFSGNLFFTSKNAQRWKISKDIRGLVFLSGKEDTYVDRDATIKTIRKKTPHFNIISYDGALHELDNELEEVTEDLYPRIINFFDSI